MKKALYALLSLIAMAGHIGVLVFAAIEFTRGDYPRAACLLLASIVVTLGAINLKMNKS